MASVLTVRRPSIAQEWIVGLDLPEDVAARLVASGEFEWGAEYELPPALYLTVDLTIAGVLYPAGTMLQVGGQVTAHEALLLMFGHGELAGAAAASIPAGGVG